MLRILLRAETQVPIGPEIPGLAQRLGGSVQSLIWGMSFCLVEPLFRAHGLQEWDQSGLRVRSSVGIPCLHPQCFCLQSLARTRDMGTQSDCKRSRKVRNTWQVVEHKCSLSSQGSKIAESL